MLRRLEQEKPVSPDALRNPRAKTTRVNENEEAGGGTLTELNRQSAVDLRFRLCDSW